MLMISKLAQTKLILHILCGVSLVYLPWSILIKGNLYVYKLTQQCHVSAQKVLMATIWTSSELRLYQSWCLGGVDGVKNPSQQRRSLLVLQVPIRLTNVWYGRLDGIMDPLPSRGWFELFKLNQGKEYQLGLSYSNFLESNSNLI